MVENSQNEVVKEVTVTTENIGDILSDMMLKEAEKNIDDLTKDDDRLNKLMDQFLSVSGDSQEGFDLISGDIFAPLRLEELSNSLSDMYINQAIKGISNTSNFSWIQGNIRYSANPSEKNCDCINQAAKTFSANEIEALFDEGCSLQNACENLKKEDVVKVIHNLLRIIVELRKDTKNVE